MELILEGDRKAMERTDWGIVLGVVVVELLRVCKCCIEEYLVEAINLFFKLIGLCKNWRSY